MKVGAALLAVAYHHWSNRIQKDTGGRISREEGQGQKSGLQACILGAQTPTSSENFLE